MDKHNTQYFHAYATANDRRLYFRDIRNLIRIRNTSTEYGKVILLIAISKAKEINILDRFFVKTVRKIFHEHASVKLQDIFFKENKGRDFSSYSALSKKIRTLASPDDYVLFQNRSAYGPFINNYFQQFIDQYSKYDSAAICGSTINFSDRTREKQLPHVQTYVFLMKVKYLEMLGDNFPGENEIIRNKAIENGEIGLSQFFLNRNYGITCIEWPDKLIGKDSNPVTTQDIKEKVSASHPFYHRQYFRYNKKRRVKNRLIKPLLIYYFTIFK